MQVRTCLPGGVLAVEIDGDTSVGQTYVLERFPLPAQ